MTKNNVFGKGLFCLYLWCIVSTQFFAQSEPGDLMFVGFNADNRDGFSVAAMREIPANTVYCFSDNEWNGLPPGAGGQFNDYEEGIMRWNTGDFNIPAGTVINFTGSSSLLTVTPIVDFGETSGEINVQGANEVIYCYQATDPYSPTNFITAITNRIFAPFTGTLEGTNLNADFNAIQLNNNADVMVYSGDTECAISVEDCIYQISSPFNWSSQDGNGFQDKDGIFPDFPRDVPPFFFGAFLPIELEAFNVKGNANSEVFISWSTLSETNNDYFTIERSTDGLEWSEVKEVPGAINSVARLEYSYTDSDPILGLSYYRLKQTDIDGQFSYSNIKAVNIDAPINLSIFPNPASENITVSGQNLNLNEIRFFDNMGHEIVLEEKGSSQLKRTFVIGDLKAGVYFLKAGEGTKSISTTFLKQ